MAGVGQGAAVRAQIIAAWQAAAYPGDDRICTPTYDDEGVAAYFRGRTWQGHDVASLRYHSVGLSFFTAEAFAYYLPAYMLAVLDDRDEADLINDSLEFHLSPDQLARQWADSYLARLASLSADQRAALIAFLEWFGGQDDTIAYLRTGQRAAEPPGTARLLQLAGAAHRDPRTVDSLRLSFTTVTDDDLAALGELPALRELDLGGTSITDAGLAHVRAASQLEVLELATCRAITAAGLAHVAMLPRLAELKLSNTGLDDAGLRALAPLALRRLDVTHARALTDAGWAALDARRLERLDMFGLDASDALLARLGDAGVLRELTARAISDAGLAALARTPLAKLEVGTTEHVTTAGLGALARLRALRTLQLGGDVATWPPGWPALAELTLLDLELRASLGDALGALPALRALRIYARRIGPGALAGIARSAHLAELTLWAARTPVALDELALAPALARLHLHDAEVTAPALAALARAPALASLSLSSVTPLDPRALAALAIHELELADMPVDDAALAVLVANPSLERLRIARATLTPAGIAAARSAHPRLELVAI